MGRQTKPKRQMAFILRVQNIKTQVKAGISESGSESNALTN
jgi:hypothetical protein